MGKTPSSGDGGVLRYSAKITSFKGLEHQLEVLEVLSHVPLLPFIMKYVLRLRDEVIDIKCVLKEHLAVRSLLHSATSLVKLPYAIACRILESILRKLFRSAI